MSGATVQDRKAALSNSSRTCDVCLDGFDWRSEIADPELLRALLAVDAFGGYRAAARAIGASPETVRRRVAQLGRRVGATLAGGRPARLTAIGELVATPARAALVALARF